MATRNQVFTILLNYCQAERGVGCGMEKPQTFISVFIKKKIAVLEALPIYFSFYVSFYKAAFHVDTVIIAWGVIFFSPGDIILNEVSILSSKTVSEKHIGNWQAKNSIGVNGLHYVWKIEMFGVI